MNWQIIGVFFIVWTICVLVAGLKCFVEWIVLTEEEKKRAAVRRHQARRQVDFDGLCRSVERDAERTRLQMDYELRTRRGL